MTRLISYPERTHNQTEVLSRGYENALLLITRTIDKVMTGEIQSQDLVVTKVLGQNIDKYKSLFPHVSAAILLAKKGIEMNAGEGVEYILQIHIITILSTLIDYCFCYHYM
jgi:DNA polymerase elongation subunit (family B)